MNSIESRRLKVRSMLHFSTPADALFVYYAFYHDAERSELYVHEDKDKRADGFVAVNQTGQRLFTPTVVLRTPRADVAIDLLNQALSPGRPYYLITTPDLRDVATRVIDIERPMINHIYHLDLLRLSASSELNVLVTPERGVGVTPRFVIRAQGNIAAEAGASWISPHFAEVFVRVEPAARGRGWGRAVLTACTRWVIRASRRPIYIVNESNEAGVALAKSVGYVDTGAREFTGEGIYRCQ